MWCKRSFGKPSATTLLSSASPPSRCLLFCAISRRIRDHDAMSRTDVGTRRVACMRSSTTTTPSWTPSGYVSTRHTSVDWDSLFKDCCYVAWIVSLFDSEFASVMVVWLVGRQEAAAECLYANSKEQLRFLHALVASTAPHTMNGICPSPTRAPFPSSSSVFLASCMALPPALARSFSLPPTKAHFLCLPRPN
eukprot:2260874-Rhodomonas_salina.3